MSLVWCMYACVTHLFLVLGRVALDVSVFDESSV